MTPETIVKNSILKYLDALEKSGHPILIKRRSADGPNYKIGEPDTYFIYNGTHVEVEFKAPGGSRSSAQIKYAQKCISHGVPYLCVNSLSQFKAFMEAKFLK